MTVTLCTKASSASSAETGHLAATGEALMRQSKPRVTHSFARLDAPTEVFLSCISADHIHAVPGDIGRGDMGISGVRRLGTDLQRLDA